MIYVRCTYDNSLNKLVPSDTIVKVFSKNMLNGVEFVCDADHYARF